MLSPDKLQAVGLQRMCQHPPYSLVLSRTNNQMNNIRTLNVLAVWVVLVALVVWIVWAHQMVQTKPTARNMKP